MTPIEFAQGLVKSDQPSDQVLGVAIIVRGLTDDTDERQGWPLDAHVVRNAALYVGLPKELVTDGFVQNVLEQAPKVSDAMLNKGASR